MSKIYSVTKSSRAKTAGLQRQWYLLDASKLPVGRVASLAVKYLVGKNCADYTPGVSGGNVLIINTDKLVVTGQKLKRKYYFWHDDSRIGSLKYRSLEEQLRRDSRRVLYLAIKRMLPANRQRDILLNRRLRLVKDDKHNLTQKLQVVLG